MSDPVRSLTAKPGVPHKNFKLNVKGQAPPTAGKKGGNGAWSKRNKARAANADTTGKRLWETQALIDLSPEGRLKRQAQCLEAMVEFGTITAGCRAANINRQTYYNWVNEDPDFKAAAEASFESFVDDLEESAGVRAKEKSDLLIIFLLKAHRSKFRDSHQTPQTSNGKVGEEEEAKAVAGEVVAKKLEALRERRMLKSGEGEKSTSNSDVEEEVTIRKVRKVKR